MNTWWCEHAVVDGRVRDDVSVSTAGGRIEKIDIGVAAPAEATQLHGLTLPGFANAHSHAFHRALRSRVQAARGTFWTWRDVMYRAAERLDPESYHRLARGVFAEMACAGMTVVGEFHYVHHPVEGTRYSDPNAMGGALLAAADEAGIRITLLDTLYLHAGLEAGGHRPPEGVQRRFTDGSVDAWVERVDSIEVNDRQLLGAAVHSVRAVDPDAMAAVADWARRTSAPIHAHLSEQRAENEQCRAAFGCTPTELLDAQGLLDTNFTAVHATHLTETDIARLGSCQCTICMCPTTERDLGDGIGPTPELAAAGAELCLGSDSHAVIDQMEEARAVELDERLRSEVRGVHGANDLLHMATLAGHRSLGWDDAGVLAVGARADLVTIDLHTVRSAGAPAALGVETAVFASTAADIHSVVIDGEPVVVDGRHVRIDTAHELATSIEELFE